MKNPQIVTLENGTVLCIEKDQVTYEPCAPGDKFTVSMQRVVIELARNLNRYVPYEQLHEVYEGRACEDMGRNLQRMKEKMPPAIKGAIKTKNGLGYQLAGTPADPRIQPPGNQGPALLAGDYYGFFLDPVGSGQVLGGYIRIEKGECDRDTEMSVSAVLGIRSDCILFGEGVADIFSAEPADRYAQFRSLHARCSPNDRRCFWGEGTVRLVKTFAELTLTTPKGAKWTVMLDLDNYLSGGRGSDPGENGKYRGGKGIYMALATQYDTFSGKFGIIRKNFRKNQIGLKDPKLQALLQTGTDGILPLRVTPIEDNYWYNWFMSE